MPGCAAALRCAVVVGWAVPCVRLVVPQLRGPWLPWPPYNPASRRCSKSMHTLCGCRHLRHRDASLCLMLAGMTAYMLCGPGVCNHQVGACQVWVAPGVWAAPVGCGRHWRLLSPLSQVPLPAPTAADVPPFPLAPQAWVDPDFATHPLFQVGCLTRCTPRRPPHAPC